MNCLDAVLSYLDSGLSVIPTDRKSKKALIKTWLPYQTALPTELEMKKWFANGKSSPAIICGDVSGGVEVIDLDERARQFDTWSEMVEEQAPGLIGKLVQQTTQSGGRHIVYRCNDIRIPGNKKLSTGAVVVSGPGMHRHGGKELKAINYCGKWVITPTLIETRGSGGYFLAAPGKGYALVNGSFTDLPVITAAERSVLHECAMIISEYVVERQDHNDSTRQVERPGDIYNKQTSIKDLISNDGWKYSGRNTTRPDGSVTEMWIRPGKKAGAGATVCNNKLHVFTSNATPLEINENYSPFAYYATMFHGGAGAEQLRSAAKELANKGYSVNERQRTSTSDNDRHPKTTLRQRCVNGASTGRQYDQKIGVLVSGFIDENDGEFTTSEIDRELSIFDRHEKQARSSALLRISRSGKVKKIKGKVGKWKIVKGGIKPMSLGIKTEMPLELPLPLGLDKMSAIFPGNIVLISGSPNSGKTAFLLTLLYTLIKKEKERSKEKEKRTNNSIEKLVLNGVRYLNSEMDEAELTNRCLAYPDGYEIFSNGCQFFQRFRNFADVIIPDGVNFIDFLEIHEDFFELGKLINEIHEELNGGICFIALQKKQGADYAKGGSASLEKPRLVLNLDRNDKHGSICKIVKCKRSIRPGDNHDGKECDFDVKGSDIIRYSAWRYVNAKQRSLYNLDYANNGMEEIPDKDYAFILRLKDGKTGRILDSQVETWCHSFPSVKVRNELRRMEADSRRKPFLDKNWFMVVPQILNKKVLFQGE